VFILVRDVDEPDANGVIHYARRQRDIHWISDWLQPPSLNFHQQRIGSAAIGNTVHLLSATTTLPGGLYHTMLTDSGQWQGWGDVISQAGLLPGTIDGLAVAGVGTDLHVVVRTSLIGLSVKLLHTIRFADGHWQKWGEIPIPPTFQTQPAGGLGSAGIDSDLHVLFGSGRMPFYTVRQANGQWAPWLLLTASFSSLLTTVALAADDKSLQACAGEGGSSLFHAIKPPGGSWSAFGSVLREAGLFATVDMVAMAHVDVVI
jgi:hypothetical protein